MTITTSITMTTTMAITAAVLVTVVGSLSNHDGDGYEDVT